MSNAHGSFEQYMLLNSAPYNTSTGSSTVNGVPEVYGYVLLNIDDPNILEQNSLEHIKKSFEKKERELNTTETTNLVPVPVIVGTSINSVSFIMKFTMFIIFIWIIIDFIKNK